MPETAENVAEDMAVSRADVDYFSPAADMVLAPGDVITVVGAEAARARARELFAVTVPPTD
jgi:K+/H+ antiporter YhaU regulatory subunit KhtT